MDSNLDPLRNPFAPGAGSQPPELAGRDAIIADAEIATKRVLAGRHARSQMLLGLRGTGKTVLLNRIEAIGEAQGYLTSLIEAPENDRLARLLIPQIDRTLRRLSPIANARASVAAAARALRNFARAFKVTVGDVDVALDIEPGIADSGRLDADLPDLFQRVGEACRTAKRGWMLLIDEVQYLAVDEFASLIVALHRVSQRNLPILCFGAGLPQIAALAGEARSYSERLFQFRTIGPLPLPDAIKAIRDPIAEEGEAIDDAALELIVERTRAYPYFLQEWGYQSWEVAADSPITAADVEVATRQALARLDDGFFRVRFDQLTPKEREYVFAMASLPGGGPYRSADVAERTGQTTRAIAPHRQAIIRKGMIYMPAHGDIAFTVPMFDEFLRRAYPDAVAKYDDGGG